MTDADIETGLRLDAERTPGEIVAQVDCSNGETMDIDILTKGNAFLLFTAYTNRKADHQYTWPEFKEWQEYKDAAFIAHAANHYADALREVQRLREELREREESDKAERTCDHCGAYDAGNLETIYRMHADCLVWTCDECGYVSPR